MANPFKKTPEAQSRSLTAETIKAFLLQDVKSLTLPMTTPTWRVAKGQGDWNIQTAITEGYNASSVVFAAVEKRAKLIASVPWKAQKLAGDVWEDAPDSPLQKLLNRPNPSVSLYELMYSTSQSLDLAGAAYISEIKGGIDGTPFELWLLPAKGIKIKAGDVRLIDGYTFTGASGRPRTIAPEDMIHLKLPNPDNPYFGQPTLKAAGRAADVDRESGDWQKSSLQNRSVMDLHIEVPENTGPEMRDEIRKKMKERQSGPANARAPLVTSGKVNQLGQTAVEMDFVNSRKSNWTEIGAVFGVPLAMLGFTENVNLANADAMKRLLWEDTIIPQLVLMKMQFNYQLASEFGPEFRMEPDLTNISALKDDEGKKLDNAAKAVSLGYTRNEVNEKYELGFDETEDGDIRYEPAGLLPQGFGREPPEGDDDQEALTLPDASVEKVQDAVLNGAQISSLSDIASSVADGTLPAETARGLIAAAFPALTAQQVDDIINPVVNFTPRELDEKGMKFLQALAYGDET